MAELNTIINNTLLQALRKAVKEIALLKHRIAVLEGRATGPYVERMESNTRTWKANLAHARAAKVAKRKTNGASKHV